ncbi:MAG: VTT domain-containing protein [Chloroflexi bacterium]|nr:VTT domain-containing protein [Chloroflexota bacterium]
MSQEIQTAQPTIPAPTSREPAPSASRLKGVVTLLLAVAVSVTIIVITTHYRNDLQKLGNAGYIGLFLVSIIGNATIIIPAPAFVVACAAGIVYGPVLVGLIAGLGASLGELTGYYAGYGGAAVLPEGKLYRRLEDFMRRHGMLAIFILAAIPNPLFDVGGMIAGILKMPVIRFVVAAWLGKALRLGVTAYACMGGLPFLQQLMNIH